jgi:succinate dehydrogenase hydrophobic anchor subunit
MRLTACIVAVLVAFPAALSLKDVMRRVGGYVDAYGDKASVVVCREKYDQHADRSAGVAETRTLVSDFALVYADAIHGWLGFRDVIKVDDRAVQDREDRLARVLMGAEGRFDEARRLSDESARFNVGNVQRNFNVPTSALFFFVSENLDFFKFASRRVLDDGSWEIAFKETAKPTLIRTPDGDPVTMTGTIWVRPQDGVIVRTILEVDVTMKRLGQRGKGAIDVRYQFIDALGMWLPASMDESFEATKNYEWDKVTGHAEYSNYRRFETSGRIRK